MFIFGVLVGRGIPLTNPSDTSLKGRFLSFLGLSHNLQKKVHKTDEIWKSIEEIKQSLDYRESLLGDSKSDASRSKGSVFSNRQPNHTPRIAYTLMVSSLRNVENAKALVEKLRAKGYSPRLETVQIEGTGVWYRVILGLFNSREEAQAFAARFNRKENMEGLVIKITY